MIERVKRPHGEAVKLLVAIPSMESWQARFGVSILSLQKTLLARPQLTEDKYLADFTPWNIKGSLLPKMRYEFVEGAIKCGATHILWMDSDMDFPGDLVHRMFQCDRAVIAVNCCTKSVPSYPTARYRDGSCVYTTREKAERKQMEKVWRVGTGIMLVPVHIYRQLRPPYGFEMRWMEQGGEARHRGEDWGMCAEIQELGINIWVDHELSWEVKHVGTAGFGHDMLEMQQAVSEVQAESA